MKLWMAFVLLAGCYDATLVDGLPCSESRQCPEGQACAPGMNVCVSEEPPHRSFLQISAGAHTCAIDTDHQLYCWGLNLDGELGLGDTEPRDVPTRVGMGADWEAVAAGWRYTVALKTDGTVWTWGTSTIVDGSNVPVRFGDLDDWKSITAGVNVWAAIDGDRAVTIAGEGVTPAALAGPWDSISVSGHHYCGLQGDDLYCWGQNQNGQVGDGSNLDDVPAPVPIRPDKRWRAVQAGYLHTCAVDDDGALWCWGDNDRGQVGLADLDAEPHMPEIVDGVSDADAVTGAFDTTCASQASGTSWCFGEGRSGEVGDANADPASIGARTVVSVVFEQLSAGFAHTCGLNFQSIAFCWGDDSSGQLGDGDLGHHVVPTIVDDSEFWDTVSVGPRHACVSSVDRDTYCWGKNGHGQLGDGSTVRRGALTRVVGYGYASISAGMDHTCGIRPDETLWCWGASARGQLGLGEGPDLNVPAQVGDKLWREVAAGDGGTCAIDTDGALWCWGRGFGFVPERVGTGTDWSQIHHASGGYMCALDDGTPYCWYLELADPPQLFDASLDLERMALGTAHACGIDADGVMHCNGDNSEGALGDGGVETDPMVIVSPTIADGWTDVAAGEAFTCGVHGDGLYCWGWNQFGLVGDGTRNSRDVPTLIDDQPGWTSVSASARSVCGIRAQDLLCWGVTHGPDGGWDEPAFVATP